MNVTKQQIAQGVSNYVKTEIIDKISDKPFKIILAIGISAIEKNPELLDEFLDNSLVSSLLKKSDDGTYDINEMLDIIETAVGDYGSFPVTVPPIKFISPDEKELDFTANDVRKLRTYIMGGGNA